MTVFFIHEQTRKGRSSLIGPFASFEKAHAAFLKELCLTEDYVYTEYDSDLPKGMYYDEDVHLEIVEREVQ
jgi:hypothetical protein